MDKLVVVGCGDHYRNILGPSLEAMEKNGEIQVLATVDIEDRTTRMGSFASEPVHVIRDEKQPLPGAIGQFRDAQPTVILAHAHDWHCKDASDLLEAGYSVILEKPYGITSKELESVERLSARFGHRLALAEYYLMMKAAPLLEVAGLLTPDSFYHSHREHFVWHESPEAYVGALDSIIGRPRMVYCDVLEGEGDTGRLEHRGRHFADLRVGIGMILDLGIHALAPVIALEKSVGRIGKESVKTARSARSREFSEFAKMKYGVPAAYVPETYAEIMLESSLGVPVVAAMGKYIIRGRNQRRVVVIGDEGSAMLDMSNCRLYVSHGDGSPKCVLESPKISSTRYVAVLRACLSLIRKESPFKFSASAVALTSNAICVQAMGLAKDSSDREVYFQSGVPPRAVFEGSRRSMSEELGRREQEWDCDASRMYFEHQYRRMAELEDHSFKMSGGVLAITAAVLAFAARVGNGSPLVSWRLLIWILLGANIIAIAYTLRINDSLGVHQKRAKEMLSLISPRLGEFDRQHPQRFVGKLRGRPALQLLLHIGLLLAAIVVLCGKG